MKRILTVFALILCMCGIVPVYADNAVIQTSEYTITIPASINLNQATNVNYSVSSDYVLDVSVSSSSGQKLSNGTSQLSYSIPTSSWLSLSGSNAFSFKAESSNTPDTAGTYTDSLTFKCQRKIAGFDYTNYNELKYLIFNGNEYIRLDINPNQFDENYTNVTMTSRSSSQKDFSTLYGVSASATSGATSGVNVRVSDANASNQIAMGYNATWLLNRQNGGTITLNKNYTIHTLLKGPTMYYYANNVLFGSFSASRTTLTTMPIFFGNMSFNNALKNNSSESHGLKGYIYYSEFKLNNSTVRKLIPARRKSDGVLGLYDTVGKKFFTSGAGSLGSGGIVY